MELGHLTWGLTFQGAAMAVEDEEYGFDIRYFGDNTCMHSDVFAELRDAARATRRIKLATGVTNTVTRHPSAVASAIAAVQLLSDGRAICGIGKGDSAVAMIGREPQRHAEFLERTARLRAYLQGESTTIGDTDSRLEWLDSFDEYRPVPLEVMCTGPKMLRAAGALADRISLNVGTAPERIAWALDEVDRGLQEAGRTRDDVEIGTLAMIAVDDDREAALDRLRVRVAPLAHMASFKGADLSSQPERLRRVTTRLRDGYDYRGHPRTEVYPTADFGNSSPIDREFADWYGLAGSASEVLDGLQGLAELGMTYAFFCALPREEREALAATVMPAAPALG